MKKILILTMVFFCVLLCSCSEKDNLLAGKWIDTATEHIIEYTDNGYYYEYVNESFTSDKTRYRVSGDKITYYIEGEDESEFSVEYEISEDKLIISGVIEYRRLEIPEVNE